MPPVSLVKVGSSKPASFISATRSAGSDRRLDRDGSAVGNYQAEIGGLGEAHDGLGEVAVGFSLAAQQIADPWQQHLQVDPVGKPKPPAVRVGELEDGDLAAALQHSMNLAKACGHVREVTDAEGGNVTQFPVPIYTPSDEGGGHGGGGTADS